jgi:hypothetical protein
MKPGIVLAQWIPRASYICVVKSGKTQPKIALSTAAAASTDAAQIV